MSKKRGETKMATMIVQEDKVNVAYSPDNMAIVVRDVKPTIVACTPQQKESASRLLGGVKLSSLPRARSRTFIAKPCTLCTALRGKDTNFTRVYATRDRVRYCKCTYCNNTWKDSDG